MNEPRRYVPTPENADDTEAQRAIEDYYSYGPDGPDEHETGLQSDEDCEIILF